MPKSLADLDPAKIKVVSTPEASKPMNVSDLDPARIKVVSQPQEEDPGLIERGSRAALKGAVAVGRAYESVTGAPTRAAISAGLKGENPFSAFGKQFADSPEKAPTGKEIAGQVGFSSEKMRLGPFKDFDGKPLKRAPDELAGHVIDVAADPTLALSEIKALGMGAKAAGEVGSLAGRAALKVTESPVVRKAADVAASKFVPGYAIARKLGKALDRVEAFSKPTTEAVEAAAKEAISRPTLYGPEGQVLNLSEILKEAPKEVLSAPGPSPARETAKMAAPIPSKVLRNYSTLDSSGADARRDAVRRRMDRKEAE